MIVVAIVGILASIASVEFSQMILRAKRAETGLMLDGIRTIEHAYMHEWEVYTYGFVDIGGDSNMAHYQATQSTKPQMLTSNTVY
jgi:Tfp pilus assembly protein PilE